MESVRDVGVLYVCDCGPRVPRTVVASPPSASTPDLYIDPCLNVSRAPAPFNFIRFHKHRPDQWTRRTTLLSHRQDIF